MQAITQIGGVTYWSVPTAAEYLGVDRSTVYRWIKEGRIVAYKTGGPNTTRVKANNIKALVRKVDAR
jgi:DNA binding domain, excisionase family